VPFSHADDFSIMADERTSAFRAIDAVARIAEGRVKIKSNFHLHRNNLPSRLSSL